MEHWVVFIDESAPRDHDGPFLVAGLVVQDRDHWANQLALRQKLLDVDPLLEYPLHATDLNLTAWYLAAWGLAPAKVRRAHRDAAVLGDAAGAVERAGRAPGAAGWLRQYVRAIDGERMPRWDVLAWCSGWIARERPLLHGALVHTRDRVNFALGRVLEGFAREYGPERCFGAVAVAPDDFESPGYESLLTTLLERLFALLRARPPAPVQLWVRAEGTVLPCQVGTVRTTRGLLAQDVARAIAQAERFPLDPPAPGARGPVQALADVPSKKGPAMHPGLVLADLLANRSLRVLRRGGPLASVQSHLLGHTHLNPWFRPRFDQGLPFSPALAPDGAAREIVREAFELSRTGILDATAEAALKSRAAAVRPLWAREQAVRWIDLARLAQ